MNKVVLILIFLIGCSALATSEPKEFEVKDLTGVSVENTSGKVFITETDGSKAYVVATKNKFGDKCKMTVERSGNKLVIKLEKTSSFFSTEECNVDFQVKVPKNVDLNITLGSGNLTVKGIHGDLAFKIGSGDILADGTFRKISGFSGSGKIALRGLIGGGELKTGSGDMDLTYAVASLNGELELKTGSGRTTILFPKGAKIKTNFKAGSGKLSNELGDTPEASFKVSMKTGSGDLNIKSY